MYYLPVNVDLKWFCRVHNAVKLCPETFRANRGTVAYDINALKLPRDLGHDKGGALTFYQCTYSMPAAVLLSELALNKFCVLALQF